MPRLSTVRVEFSKEHDNYLFKYLARYCPSKEGRSGLKIFQQLVANEQKLWPWSTRHTWQSWRARYVKNSDHFDALILNYQQKHNIKRTEGKKRAYEPMPIEMLGPRAKRVKLDAAESGETRTEQGATAQYANSRPSTSKLISKHPREPQEAPVPSMVHPPREPEPTDVRPSSPPLFSTNTKTDATKKPSLDLRALETRHDTLEISSSSPDKPAPPPTDGKPEFRSPSRAVKRVKERPRASSEAFASEPSSPMRDLAVVDVGATPVTDTVYPRAPPRVVDSFHGQVLVDQKGRVPRVLPHGKEDGAEEGGEEEVKARWPPARDRTAKLRRASGPDVEVAAHHAFSQPQPQFRPEAPRESVGMGERERGKPHHPFARVSPTLNGALLDRRTVAGLFSAGVESERRGDAVRNGASPVKRVVPPAPAPDSLSGPIPKRFSEVSKFPAPRASTRSPFRPEPPAGETRHSPPRPQPRTKAARHPSLTRMRRQTIGHGNGNGSGNGYRNGHEREHGQVPSVDLVALSRSSMSARSHSRSSAGTSVPARPSRWSLPAFAHATPWVFDEPGGVPSAPGSVLGSGSGSPFRWVAPSPVYSDIWGHGHARTSPLVGTSTPQLTFTPSPARSVAAAVNTYTNASAPHPNAIPISPSVPLAPHSADVPLVASHGLASILAHMSANHGLALGVVEAVYTRVGSLREADEVLKGMREAAEGFGEREIERRVRGRREERQSGAGREGRNGVGHEERGEERGNGDGDGKERQRTRLQYVVASEDGEGSEYSPPETSRAAMWKRQSESVSYVEEGEEEEEEEEGEGEDREDRDEDEEEEEEGRAVEKELWEGEGENSDEDTPHDFSQCIQEALLDNMKAQELERKLGKRLYRKHIVRQFI